jgi:glycosyltransferase involved in cell wall biosynthesis
MRIVYMLASLGVGGAEKQVLALATRMAARGHIVMLVTLLPTATEEWPTSLPVIRLNLHRNPFSLVRVLGHACSIIRRLKPELIHSNSFHANIITRLVSPFAGQPIIVSTIHNVYEGGWLRMFAYRLTDGLCARTTTVSQAVADRFVRLKAVRAEKCAVVLNAIDLGEFTPGPARRGSTRAAMDGQQKFIWLAAGRITPAKDYPNLLRAFARVLKSHPNAFLWIAGQGSEQETARLLALAANLGLGRSIQSLGLRRDLPALLDAADGFVSSSAWEGMPLAIAEAMAMEKPVVATNVGGVSELVGEAGSLVLAHNPEALADAMLKLMREPETDRFAIARSARLRIHSGFNLNSRVEEWETLYHSLVSVVPNSAAQS